MDGKESISDHKMPTEEEPSSAFEHTDAQAENHFAIWWTALTFAFGISAIIAGAVL